MSFFLITLAIIGSVCATDIFQDGKSNLNEHIVGGHYANIAQYPFIVSLRVYGYHFCGGSIYTSRLILTAAHCLKNVKYMESILVVAGSTTLWGLGQWRDVKAGLIHPKFQHLQDHDIGILELMEPLVFGDCVLPIKIATKRPPAGSQVTVLGWGYTKENTNRNSALLQEVSVSVVKNDVCKATYDRIKKDLITPFILCAGSTDGSKDACSNDSGGPLVFENQLVGIVSFGLGCARKGYPGIYTSVADLHEWIFVNTL